MKRISLLGVLALAITFQISAQKKKEMDELWGDKEKNNIEELSEKAQKFDDDNYAMFIHWGLYSNLANKWKGKTYYGIGEWIMNPRVADIPKEEYKETAQTFNPVNFDAKAIVSLAKDAGMRYIVITSKHHDGFAMYNSKSNDFNIVKKTPFARDPMKELANECAKQGIGFGFYYSHNQDWTYPGGAGGPTKNEKGKEVDFDYYFKEKCLPQVKEITSEYGDIRVVWFDTPGQMPKKFVEELVKVTEKNQPNVMISGRAGHGLGHYNSLGDMEVPLKNEESLWESVDVTNDSWGYAWYDNNWKSPKLILERLISTIARRGTYMLNVGPDPSGVIPEMAQKALRASGAWIKEHPEIIYKAGPSPWKRALPWGDVTTQGKDLNLIVYKWPQDGRLYLSGIAKEGIESITLNDEELFFDAYGQGVSIKVPYKQPHKFCSVIKVTRKSESVSIDPSLSLDPDFEASIHTEFAKSYENVKLSKIRWMEKFGEWKHTYQAKDWEDGGKVTWEILVPEAGVYDLHVIHAGEGKVVWNFKTDENEMLQNQQEASRIYGRKPMGWVTFKTAGKHTITASLVSGEKASLQELIISKVDF